MVKERPCQRCPKCGIKIYLGINMYFNCPIHGAYKLNYNTGNLEPVGGKQKSPPC